MISSVAVIGATPAGRALAAHLDAARALAAFADADPDALVGCSWPTRSDLGALLTDPALDAVVLAGSPAERAALAEAGTGQRVVHLDATRFRPAVRAAFDALPELGPVVQVAIERRTAGAADPARDLDLLVELLGGAQTVQAVGSTRHVVSPSGTTGFVNVLGDHPNPGLRLSVLAQGGSVVVEGGACTVHRRVGPAALHHLPGDGLAEFCAALLAGAELPTPNPALRAAAAASAMSGEPTRVEARDWFAHPTVEIDGPDVKIGAGTRIWHFSKLLGPLEIGAKCSLGQNVVVERGVKLGDNVKVQNNVSIYSGVILEDDVFCGPSMVFTNVGTPRSHFPRRGEYLITRCKQGASIGANATIVCGNTLGRYCFVGAGAVVTKDVPDFALVYGNPARVRAWACYCGVTLPFGIDVDGSETAECAHCGRQYAREGHVVRMTGE